MGVVLLDISYSIVGFPFAVSTLSSDCISLSPVMVQRIFLHSAPPTAP